MGAPCVCVSRNANSASSVAKPYLDALFGLACHAHQTVQPTVSVVFHTRSRNANESSDD